jgi:hypothetical protein
MKKFTTTNEAFNIQIVNFNTSLASRLRTFTYYTYVFSPCCESIYMFELLRIFSGFVLFIFYYVYWPLDIKGGGLKSH